MFDLHIGALPLGGAEAALYDDRTGLHIHGKKQEEVQFAVVDDDTDLHFIVTAEHSSWRNWGEHNLDGTLHFTVRFRGEPSVKQVQIIYRDIEDKLISGRLHDVAVLTNQENWSQVDTDYLFNSTPSGVPIVVPASTEPRKEGE